MEDEITKKQFGWFGHVVKRIRKDVMIKRMFGREKEKEDEDKYKKYLGKQDANW